MIMTMIMHIRTSVGAVPAQVMPGSMFRGGNSPWSKGALTYQPQNFELHNTKYKIQNTKFKIQNTKYKIQNAKYKLCPRLSTPGKQAAHSATDTHTNTKTMGNV